MDNMRRILKQPMSLRLMNGGDPLLRPLQEPQALQRPPQTTEEAQALQLAQRPPTSGNPLLDRLSSRLGAGTLTLRGAQLLNDVQSRTDTNATNRLGIETQAATSRYGADKSFESSKYGVDTQATTSKYSADKNFDATKYGADTQAATSKANAETQAASSKYGADTQLAGSKFSATTGANASRYGADKNFEGAQYQTDAKNDTFRFYGGGQNNGLNSYVSNVQANGGFAPASPGGGYGKGADYGSSGGSNRGSSFSSSSDFGAAAPAGQPDQSSSFSGSGQQQRGLRFANGGELRTGHGGNVPGKGEGDKIPAKYEPGEFVVSNDMLDAAPGLRGQLHDLRGNVLAQQGKSVAEADAKAVGGGGLRASEGFGLDYLADWFKRVGSLEMGSPQTGPSAYEPAAATTERAGVNSAKAAADQATGRASALSAAGDATGAARGAQEAAQAAKPASVAARAGGWLGNSLRGLGVAGGAYGVGSTGFDFARSAANTVASNPDYFLTDKGDAGLAANIMAVSNPDATTSALPKAIVNAVAPEAAADSKPALRPSAPNPTAQRLANGNQAAPLSLRNPNEVKVERMPLGNMSFSGGPNIGKDGKDVAYTGDKFGGYGTVSTLGSPGDGRRVMEMNNRLADGMRAEREAADAAAGAGQAAMGRAASAAQDRWDRKNAMTGASARFDDAGRQAAINNIGVIDARTANAAKESAETARAKLTADGATANSLRTNATALQGHQMDLEGRLAPVKAAAEQRARAAQVFAMAQGDNTKAIQMGQALGIDVKPFLEARTADAADASAAQGLSEKFRENAKKEFRVADTKDPSKWNEPASEQAFNAVRQLFPKMESANENDRNKAMSDAKELHGIFLKARAQDPVGWDAAKIWQPKPAPLSAMPNATDGKTELVSPLEGMVTWGASGGDTLLKTRNGKTLNLGVLTGRELELLETAKKSGWGN